MSRLQKLHDLLLDRDLWPECFEWDYSEPSQCALGLAYEADMLGDTELLEVDTCAWLFDLDPTTFSAIFFTPTPGGTYQETSPEMVALRIRQFLEGKEQPHA